MNDKHNPYEHNGRMKKAIAIAEFLHKGDIHSIQAWTKIEDAEWWDLARIGAAQLPSTGRLKVSIETRNETIRQMERIEQLQRESK